MLIELNKRRHYISQQPFNLITDNISNSERAERKRISAKRGHIKRKIARNEPLTGEALEFAISVAGGNSEIVKKLKAGQPLDDYELHLMLDVHWLYMKSFG